ncbi:MAG: aminotransferase class III-fold pyridoxal phosphate-dependent enzyme [Gammaproteobacteria bacterium]|nr:MAG: aminotransferase class III-fold pyridoxal phosphate-dependent enzyme [Gammaproteobacteria bacterium]
MLPATLTEALRHEEERFTAANPRSRAQFETACRWLPGGSTRTTVFYPPFPLMMARGEGAFVWDLDGHRYCNFLGEYTVGVCGHDPALLDRILAEISRRGLMLSGPTEFEARLAELICSRFPSCELIRFCNSGTEANLLALALARRATGREAVLVFQGSYHGGFLTYAVDDGPLNVPLRTVKARYNDVAGTQAIIGAAAGDLGAILVEPMLGAAGCIPGNAEFLQMLRDEATRRGIVLIFDEVMTSRLAPGGLQEQLAITPDLTTFGKYLGGGFSFGACGGRRQLLAMLDARNPGFAAHGGTFNNNVASMIGGYISLSECYTPQANRRLNALGDQLRSGLNELADRNEVPLRVSGRGAVMNVHFTREREIATPGDTGDANSLLLKKLLHLALLGDSVYIASRGLISLGLMHSDEDLESLIAAVRGFVLKHRVLLEQCV